MNRTTLLAAAAGLAAALCAAAPPEALPPATVLPETAPAGPGSPRVRHLLARMTLEEKIGQLSLRGRGSRGSHDEVPAALVEAVRAGHTGALINVMVPSEVDRLQRVAVEASRLGIPLLVGRDVIHGLHAVQPIPLGQAASWDPGLVEAGARAAAEEAAAYGVNWTFAPMVDVARDPRWGRIAESFGEDPYLSSVLAAAMVRGFQGDDLAAPGSIAACAKHFAGYGAGEGGRDYAAAAISESELRNVYLPPFRAAVEAGAATLMSGFHEVDGVPVTGDRRLLTDVLRGEWGFDGFVVSDWNSVTEMIAHGFAADERAAARVALAAGVDLEMTSESYERHLAGLVAAGEIDLAAVDAAVARVLGVKERLGLFERPYRPAGAEPGRLDPGHLETARRLALEGAVLLRNEGAVLPLAEGARVAVVGPLADAPREQLGTWTYDGRAEDSVTPLSALRARLGERLGDRLAYAPGLAYSRDRSRAGFAEAIAAARAADLVLFFGGEEAILSGEAHSRADLRLPGAQEELIRELAAAGKPVVLVLLAGRPIALHDVLGELAAVLVAWHPGTMGGPALADLLLGVESPSGRLPVTWPKAAGQVPIYYAHKRTGRPADPEKLVPFDDIPVGAWQSSLQNTSHYLDLGAAPEYPFGFGLTYSSFEYGPPRLDREAIGPGDRVRVSATVTNTGGRRATEVAQLYVRDLVGSRTRPVRELKGFRRVTLDPGASERVTFTLGAGDLEFFDGARWIAEPGRFEVWIAPDAASGIAGGFELVDGPAARGEPAAVAPAAAGGPALTGRVERLSPALDALIDPAARPEVLAEGFVWSEGPLWIADAGGGGGSLLFSDVPRDSIYRWREDDARWRENDGLSLWLRPSGYTGDVPRGGEPGSNGLALDAAGRLVLCQHGDRRLARLDAPLDRPLAGPRPVFETLADRHDGRRFNSPNDLAVARDGAVYFTDPPYGLAGGPDDPAREIPIHGIYRRAPDGAVTLLTGELSRPNGVALSPDERTLYVANSDPGRALWMAYDLAPDGSLGAGRVLFDATAWVGDKRPGLPDGLKVDRLGNLFATGPGGVLIFSPAGEHLGTVRTGRPTANCAFGGDGSTLYMTAGDALMRIPLRTRGAVGPPGGPAGEPSGEPPGGPAGDPGAGPP